MYIGIYCKQTEIELETILDELLSTIQSLNFKVWIHPDSYEVFNRLIINKNKFSSIINLSKETPSNLSLMITIGGDGTFLSGIAAINYQNIPLLGINTGRLGFLSDISPNEIKNTLHCIANNKHHIEYRSLLQCTSNYPQPFPLALNEITVHKQDSSSMIIIHTYIDDEFLASYMADGLIIATPTGSTAYSMSAGGPIISPDTQAFVITPIAPHNLTARPLVIPDNKTLKLKIACRDQNFRVALDSNSFVIDERSELTIQKSQNTCSLIKLNEHNFYKTIRNKLMWGVDKRF